MNHICTESNMNREHKTGLRTFPTSRAMVKALKPVEPLYCIYPSVIRDVVKRFVEGFPGTVMYAVKANPNPDVIREIYNAGVRHFDTASIREIALIKEMYPDAVCYFMAICKLSGAAESAFADYGVRNFVADHITEVERLLKFATPDTTIHIRMKAFDPASVYELSSKFGATEQEAVILLRRVGEAKCKVGMAFNVGSQCLHPDAYRKAIQSASQVVKESGVTIESLDVGGGFPVNYPGFEIKNIEEFFEAIGEEVAISGLSVNCRTVCEPGRALVAEGQTLLTQVILLKDDLVFLNEGIYGGFKELDISNDCVRFPPKVIRLDGIPSCKNKPYVVSGPTCDSLDTFPKKIDLPIDLQIGDWIEFSLSGAYSNAMATRFNGLFADQWVRIETSHGDHS